MRSANVSICSCVYKSLILLTTFAQSTHIFYYVSNVYGADQTYLMWAQIQISFTHSIDTITISENYFCPLKIWISRKNCEKVLCCT